MTEREAIVAWLRGMNATEWNAMMAGRKHLPWAYGVADAIERGDLTYPNPNRIERL